MSSTSKHLFLAATVLTTLLVSATSADFDSYMLSLQWPPSFCSINDCKKPISNLFVVHGFWPQFASGRPVPPYDPTTNKCNDNPTKPAAIIPLLGPIIPTLNIYWPDLYKNGDNYRFWRLEWERHGMCSDYPQDPKGYFEVGLNLARNNKYNPLKVIGIPAGGRTTLNDILKSIQTKLEKNAQIYCLTDKSGRNLLVEVRFCFAREKPPSTLVDCPRTSSNCPSSGPIVVPEAPRRVSELDIIEEVVSV